MTYAERFRVHELEIERLDRENRALRVGLAELRALCRSLVERVLTIPTPAAAATRKCAKGKGGAR